MWNEGDQVTLKLIALCRGDRGMSVNAARIFGFRKPRFGARLILSDA